MKEMAITCINCPIGCRVTVSLEGDKVVSVQGNTCKRGDTYARQECVAPQRVVTASAPVLNASVPVSVKTNVPIPKEKISACMDEILRGHFSAPIHTGDVLLAHVCGTSADVVATRDVL